MRLEVSRGSSSYIFRQFLFRENIENLDFLQKIRLALLEKREASSGEEDGESVSLLARQ